MTASRRRGRALVAQAQAAGLLGSSPASVATSTSVHYTHQEPRPMSEIYVTPLVRKQAEAHRVDLAKLKGTGTGGRITLDDVRAAAGIKRPSPAAAAPPVSRSIGSRPSLRLKTTSRYATDMTRIVTIDVFADNPLFDDIRQVDPDILSKAQRMGAGPVPELFTTGPLPAFTSSGIDPSILAQVPYVLRPYMARIERPGEALELVEAYGKGEEYIWEDALRNYRSDPGAMNYEGRMLMWWRAATTAPTTTINDWRASLERTHGIPARPTPTRGQS